jgi:hypothetical protein
VLQSKELQLYLHLPLLASHSLKVSRHSDPERSRMGRTAFGFAVAYFSTPSKKIISAEAEILQFHPRLFSADKIRLFPVDCAHSLNGCLHRHADNLPIVTILSMPKLVKTLVSPSS